MSDGASAKFEGWETVDRKLEDLIRALDDKRAIEEVGLEAVAPLLEDVRARVGPIEPWRERGYTAAHIISGVDKESTVSEVRVAVGAVPGPNQTLRMLEGGTSKMPAQAPLAKAYDSKIGEVRDRYVKGLQKIAGVLTR